MGQSQAQKEELLSLLTEIYDQLEELERAIDTNLSKERKEMVNHQSEKLSKCEVQLKELENSMYNVVPIHKGKAKVNLPQNKKLKLELGF